MSIRPRAILPKFPGTNCDAETALALAGSGFAPQILPIAEITARTLDDAQLVVFSGGFSYGDYVIAGRFAQLELESRLGDKLKSFCATGGYVLGICNGFQIMTKLGILPKGSLITNRSGRFMCRWVRLKKSAPSPFTADLPDEFEFPIAHAEGRFVADGDAAQSYAGSGLVPLLYSDGEAVNGSQAGIAALHDETGRAFGLMPHPERFTHPRHHYDPDWSGPEPWGKTFFASLHKAMA